MVIAIMQTTSDRLRTVFRLMTDFRQTSVRRQTPTSDSGPRLRTDFEQSSDFGLQSSETPTGFYYFKQLNNKLNTIFYDLVF